MKINRAILAATAILTLNLAAQAQTNLAITGDPTGTIRNDTYSWGAGFGFYVPAGTGTTINALGYWDQGGDGLLANHTVCLYKYSGSGSAYNLIASVTIAAGTADPLIDGYRWVTIPDLSLSDNGQGGDYYSLLAAHDSDPWTDLSGQTINGAIGTIPSSLGGVLVANNSGQTLGQDPVNLVAVNNGYGGPNMGYIATVPEPASCVLLGVGVIMLAGWRRKQ